MNSLLFFTVATFLAFIHVEIETYLNAKTIKAKGRIKHRLEGGIFALMVITSVYLMHGFTILGAAAGFYMASYRFLFFNLRLNYKRGWSRWYQGETSDIDKLKISPFKKVSSFIVGLFAYAVVVSEKFDQDSVGYLLVGLIVVAFSYGVYITIKRDK